MDWYVVYDSNSVLDGFFCETFEEAKKRVMELYASWVKAERKDWKKENGVYVPTKEQVNAWNRMIDNYNFYVWNYKNPDIIWGPDEEELIRIGWVNYNG